MFKEIKLFNQEMLEVLECKREKLIRSTQIKKILPRQNSLPLWPHLYLKNLRKREQVTTKQHKISSKAFIKSAQWLEITIISKNESKMQARE